MSIIKHVLKNGNEKITSLYGNRTFMMRGKKVSDFHKGIDLIDAKNKSDYVIAFEDGVVISSRDEVKGYDEKKSSGNYVYLNHDNNYQTRYFHMAYGTVMVKEGDRVKKGDVLGYTGATGWVTGIHVHFEIKENGVNQDPLPYLEGKKHILKDKVYLGELQEVNVNVNQITVSTLNDSLRVRDNPNGNILGYVKNGTYNFYDKVASGDYEWYKIGDNMWIAYSDEWASVNYKKEEVLEKEEEKKEANYELIYTCDKNDVYAIRLYKGEKLYIKKEK